MDGRLILERVWALLVSMRTSAALLLMLSLLMLLNVLVPQEGSSPEAYRLLVERGAVTRFLLETAGFGNVSTSPVFKVVLWFFFLSLVAVLADRTGSTLRRLRARAPGDAQLRALVDRGALEIAADRGWSPQNARRILEGLGYRVAPAGEGALWAVRHQAAVLGFPLFHLSFFVLCAAGVQLYLTREVGMVVATEGQRIEGPDVRVVRRAPAGGVPPLDLVLERVDVDLERGRPTGIAASLRSGEPGAPPRTARVNHPAEWGALAVLVESVGLAPVLSLVDARGYTGDRVAVVVSNDSGATTVALGEGRVQVTLEPIPVGAFFPERAALPRARLRARIRDGERIAFDGVLAPQVPVPVGDLTVRMDEIRYWARLRLVHERGGALLVFGFCVLVTGIAWRMVWFRREVAVVWDAGRVRLAGRGEFFPARFREELAGIRELLENPQRVGVRERG